MNGKFMFLTAAFAVLAGCGSEKDAEYYFNNPEKLKSLLEECDAKLRNAKSQEEVEALSGNKECTTAELAKKAIRPLSKLSYFKIADGSKRVKRSEKRLSRLR